MADIADKFSKLNTNIFCHKLTRKNFQRSSSLNLKRTCKSTGKNLFLVGKSAILKKSFLGQYRLES